MLTNSLGLNNSYSKMMSFVLLLFVNEMLSTCSKFIPFQERGRIENKYLRQVPKKKKATA